MAFLSVLLSPRDNGNGHLGWLALERPWYGDMSLEYLLLTLESGLEIGRTARSLYICRDIVRTVHSTPRPTGHWTLQLLDPEFTTTSSLTEPQLT